MQKTLMTSTLFLLATALIPAVGAPASSEGVKHRTKRVRKTPAPMVKKDITTVKPVQNASVPPNMK